MNTIVSFKIKQLLYNKGWEYELGVDETDYRVKHSLAEQRWNEGNLTYVDITIFEIIMWLYEKHRIWISVDTLGNIDIYPRWNYKIIDLKNSNSNIEWELSQLSVTYEESAKNSFNSPIEAYESAIEYILIKHYE